MHKLLLFFKSTDFRKHLLYALLFFVGLVVLVMFGLRIYTRQGNLVAVPNFKGMSVSEAQKIAAGQFKLQIGYTYVDNAKPNSVLDQSPNPKTMVKPDRSIYLNVVSPKKPTITLPNLTDVSKREAKAILNSYGIKIKEEIYKQDEAKDVVLGIEYKGKQLKPGMEIERDAEVVMYLGNGFGSEKVNVPNVTLLTLEEATFVLRGNSLLVGKVHYDEGVNNPSKAVVYRQEPTESTDEVDFGTAIDLYLRNQ